MPGNLWSLLAAQAAYMDAVTKAGEAVQAFEAATAATSSACQPDPAPMPQPPPEPPAPTKAELDEKVIARIVQEQLRAASGTGGKMEQKAMTEHKEYGPTEGCQETSTIVIDDDHKPKAKAMPLNKLATFTIRENWELHVYGKLVPKGTPTSGTSSVPPRTRSSSARNQTIHLLLLGCSAFSTFQAVLILYDNVL